jgi:hypothetical protein
MTATTVSGAQTAPDFAAIQQPESRCHDLPMVVDHRAFGAMPMISSAPVRATAAPSKSDPLGRCSSTIQSQNNDAAM